MAFKFLAENIDATASFTSEAVQRSRSYDWSLILIPTGLDADYKITLEVSDDGVNYAAYKLDGQLIDHTKSCPIFDSILIGDFFRFKYDPNGNSTGTISATFNIKYK